MSSASVAAVQALYAAFAKGDVAAVLGLLAPGIVWREAENFPYADRNPYVGPEAVAAGVFGRIADEWNGFAVAMDEVLDAGDKVVALGRYTGVAKATGKTINAQVVHVWTVVDGKLATFQQYADTLQVARALD